MRLTGTLRSWNDDRGFGFIAPTSGGAEIFVHISELPRDGARPSLNERVTFEIKQLPNGKRQAVSVRREALVASIRQGTVIAKPIRPPVRHWKISLILLVALAAVGGYAYKQHIARASLLVPPTTGDGSTTPISTSAATATGYRCDGRRYCSQMTSCGEAKFFIQNCPNTQMDGNGDGVPCEQQWCTSIFSK